MLFSGVSAWVNRLFEVSESWISEAAPVIPPPLALKLNHSQVKLHFEPAALYHNSVHFPLYSPAAQRSRRKLRRGGRATFRRRCQMCKKGTFQGRDIVSELSLFPPADNCNGPLVSTLPQSSFQSSSQSSASYAAYNAKLNRRDGELTSVP